MIFNTEQLKKVLTRKNKAFITRVANNQEKKYGNIDIFDVSIFNNEINFSFGDYWIKYKFDNAGNIRDTYGYGQGHKYHPAIDECVKELYNKYCI